MKKSTTSTNSYYELLRHPKWQKKRLSILDQSGFCCEVCESEDKTLNVHHTYYEKGLNPWDYPEQSLHCLCEQCHKKAQNIKTLINRQLGQVDLSEHEMVLGYMAALSMQSCPPIVTEVFSFEMASGIGDAYGIDGAIVMVYLIDGKIDGFKLDEIKKLHRNRGGNGKN